MVVWPSSGTNNRAVLLPSGTRDNCQKSGTVPEIQGQLEPMYTTKLQLVHRIQYVCNNDNEHAWIDA